MNLRFCQQARHELSIRATTRLEDVHVLARNVSKGELLDGYEVPGCTQVAHSARGQ